MKDRDIDDIIPFEERMNSLNRRNRDIWVKDNMPKKTEIIPIIDIKTYESWEARIAPKRTSNNDIKKINDILGTSLALYQDTEEAFATIYELKDIAKQDSRRVDSVVLDRVLSEIDKRIIDDGSGWKKKIAIGGTTALWIVARKIIPKFKTADEVINDIERGNWKNVVTGMIKIIIPRVPIQCYSWLIKELKDSSD